MLFYKTDGLVKLGGGVYAVCVFTDRKLHRYREGQKEPSAATAVVKQILQILIWHKITSRLLCGKRRETMRGCLIKK